MSTNSYRTAATNNFNALKKLYEGNDDPPCAGAAFWKLGTSFDTMIDYFDVIDSTGASSFSRTVFAQFNASAKCLGGLDNAWFDDFGWWTVAARRALQKSFFDPVIFQTIHDECWKRFRDNAPYVWQRRQPGTFNDYGPAVLNGVWNAYWDGTSSQYPGPKNGDPSSGTLVGIQNTVTNALFLMAAQRDPNSQQEAQNEFDFLFTWLNHAPGLPFLWWSFGPNVGLVRERVSGFAGGKSAQGQCPEPTGFQLDWAWTGDQGLMLGNFSDAMSLQPKHASLLLAMAKAVITGALQALFRDGQLQNYTKTGCVPDGDVSDYQTGTGVFWRNVLYVWKTNGSLRTFLNQPEYQKMLRASADAVVNASPINQSIETLTNRTAVLVAATAMLS